MPTQTKAMLVKENLALRRQIARMKKNLTHSKDRARAIFNAMPDLFFETNAAGVFLDYFAQDRSALFAEPGDFLGKNLMDVLPKAVATAAMDAVREALTKKDLSKIKYSLAVNGEARWYEGKVMPLGADRALFFIRDVTGSQRAREALADAYAKMEKLFEVLPVGVSILDRQNHVVKQNPALEKILGISAEGFARGEYRSRQYVHPDGAPMLPGEFASARVMNGEPQALDVETGVMKENDEIAWVNVSAAAVPFSDWGAVVVVSDVTDRKRAEKRSEAALEALRRSETKFRLVAENGMDGLMLLDACGRITYRSPSYQVISGHGVEEPLAQAGLEAIYEGDREKIGADLSALLQNPGQEITGEYRVKHKDGSLRWVASKARNLLDDPDVGSIVITSSDITQRKLAEDALRESEDKFKYVFEHLNVGNSITQIAGEIRVNKAFCDMTGYLPEELAGKRWQDITHPEDIELTQNAVDALVSGKTDKARFLKRFIKKDGSIMWADLSSVLRRHADGRPMYMATSLVDVTDRKRAEEELACAHQQLQELSRQLLDAQENERRVIARELHDEIGQSLTGLKLLIQMAQRPPVGENAAKIQEAQRVADDLIERVSRLSLNLRPKILDDFGLLSALLWLVDTFSAQTEIQIDFAHEGLREKRFDPEIESSVFRLVQSALTNVARHADARRVLVKVSASDSELKTYVEDTGRGFDLEAERIHNKSAGLNGMRERVRLLGGKLEINTAPNRGTRVSICIPLTPAERVAR